MAMQMRCRSVVTFLALACVLGCGPARVESRVTGVVTGGGRPLADAVIVFQSLDAVTADERTFRTVSTADGRYEVAGIRPGSYEVIVVPAGGRDGQTDQVAAADALGPAGGGPLRVDVGSEPAAFDITLVPQR